MGLEGFATVADLAHFRVTKSDTASDDEDWTSGMVTGVFRHIANSVYLLRYDNGDSLGVTGTHPLYSLDRQQFTPVSELRIGEKLLSKSGTVTLTEKTFDPTPQEVYNLEVGQWHNFLVGSSGVVVHNGPCNVTFEEFVNTVSDFKPGGAKEHLAQDAYNLFVKGVEKGEWKALENFCKSEKIGEWNGIIWPPNNGGFNAKNLDFLDPKNFGGTLIIDRYGLTTGKYVAPFGTPFSKRALPASFQNQTANVYKVVKPIPNVEEATIIPWFNQQGLGKQYRFEKSVQYYLDEGFLIKIE